MRVYNVPGYICKTYIESSTHRCYIIFIKTSSNSFLQSIEKQEELFRDRKYPIMKLIIIFTVLVVFASADNQPNSAASRILVKRQNSGTNFSCTPQEIENILTDECTDEFDVVNQSNDILTDSAAIVALCASGCLNQIVNVFQMCANLSVTNFVSFVCGHNDQGERCPSIILQVDPNTADIHGNCLDTEERIPLVCPENCTQATFSDAIANLGCCINYLGLSGVLNTAGEVFTFLDALTQCGVEVPRLCDIGLELPATTSPPTTEPTMCAAVPTATVLRFSVLSFVVVLVAAAIF